MPSLSNIQTIRDAVIAIVRTAWPDITEVGVEEQLLPAEAPFALVQLQEVQNERGGGRNFHQSLSFVIHGRWKYPDSATCIEDAKLSKGTALALLLEASTTFAGVAFDPIVDGFELNNDDIEEQTYDLRVRFSCSQSATWGV